MKRPGLNIIHVLQPWRRIGMEIMEHEPFKRQILNLCKLLRQKIVIRIISSSKKAVIKKVLIKRMKKNLRAARVKVVQKLSPIFLKRSKSGIHPQERKKKRIAQLVVLRIDRNTFVWPQRRPETLKKIKRDK